MRLLYIFRQMDAKYSGYRQVLLSKRPKLVVLLIKNKKYNDAEVRKRCSALRVVITLLRLTVEATSSTFPQQITSLVITERKKNCPRTLLRLGTKRRLFRTPDNTRTTGTKNRAKIPEQQKKNICLMCDWKNE